MEFWQGFQCTTYIFSSSFQALVVVAMSDDLEIPQNSLTYYEELEQFFQETLHYFEAVKICRDGCEPIKLLWILWKVGFFLGGEEIICHPPPPPTFIGSVGLQVSNRVE